MKNPPANGCNMAVYGNPDGLFTIRTSVSTTSSSRANAADEYEPDFPTVLSGNSDMTYEVTNWIAASTSAEASYKAPQTSGACASTPTTWG